MYIWKTQNLVSDLIKGQVNEKEKLKYMIFLGVAYAILSDPVFAIGIEYSMIDAANLFVIIVLTVLGTIYVYKNNSNGDNTDFITRYTCLSVPIGVKMFILALIAGIISGIIDVVLMSESIEAIDESFTLPTSPIQVIATALIMILFYYYLGKRIGEVSTNNTN